MSEVELTSDEEIVVKVLTEKNCTDIDSSIAPTELIAKCEEAGIDSANTVERCVVSLIDKDVIEYEMNESCDVTDIWLL